MLIDRHWVRSNFGLQYQQKIIEDSIMGIVMTTDVTEIWQQVLDSIHESVNGKAFATWFNRIIANRVADYHRKMFRQKSRFTSEEEMPENEMFEEANVDLEMEDLLMNLPEHYREVILMKLIYNLSFGEIASSLGMTYEAARSRYRRGIKYAASRIDSNLLMHN